MTVITWQEIREHLRMTVSRAWVYAHWRDLGATKIGGKVIFTREGLNNALQGSGEMAGSSPRGRQAGVGELRYEAESKGLGRSDESGADYLKTIGVI
jgi:hypothetical protein